MGLVLFVRETTSFGLLLRLTWFIVEEMNEQKKEAKADVDNLQSSLQKQLSVSGNKNDSGDESGEDVKVGVAAAAASSCVLSPSQIEFYLVCGCGEEKVVCGTCGQGCQIKQEDAVNKGLAIYEDDMFILLNDEEDDYDSDEDNTKYDIIHSDEELEVDTDEDDTDDDDCKYGKSINISITLS